MIDPAEIELVKRQIEAQLAEYEQAVIDAAAFLADWRVRHDPAQKRINRFRHAAERA